MIQKFFNRFEIKYLIGLNERDRLVPFFKGFMELDHHTQNGFNYEIRSLYFDSLSKKSFYEKESGIRIRKKLRIRFYPDFISDREKLVFIEIKKKNNENVSKTRIVVPIKDAYEVIDKETDIAKEYYRNLLPQDKKTLEEIWYINKRSNLKPACIISYKRQPYVSKAENRFRITFDTNLTVRNYDFDLQKEGGIKVIPKTECIMEIKFNSFIPNWAIKVIQTNNCIQQKISKFARGLERTKTFSIN